MENDYFLMDVFPMFFLRKRENSRSVFMMIAQTDNKKEEFYYSHHSKFPQFSIGKLTMKNEYEK